MVSRLMDVPADGVPIYNARVCGTDWVDIHMPNASYYNVYNDDFGRETCVVAELHHLDFRISSVGQFVRIRCLPEYLIWVGR